MRAILVGVPVLFFIVTMWLIFHKWGREEAEERAREEEWDRKFEEELPLLKHILNAPDSEYEGMSLSEAMGVTREKRLKGKENAQC